MTTAADPSTSRERFRATIREAGLDALVLGHPADVAFASGVSSLWTSGSRPFGASCVIVGDDVHVLSTWDDGVPDDVDRSGLFGLSWNPEIAAANLAAIGGLTSATKIGLAGANPGTERTLRSIAPDAEFVDARELVAAARAVKPDEEFEAIARACGLAGDAGDAMREAARPGITTRELAGALASFLGRAGWPVLPDTSVAHDLSVGHGTVLNDHPIKAGTALALTPTVRVNGFHGTVGRTIVLEAEPTRSQEALAARCSDGMDAVVAACVDGATGTDLIAAFETATAARIADLPILLAHGIGRGMELPLIGLGVGDDARIVDGSALVIQSYVAEPGLGAWLERSVVFVSGESPTLVSGLGSAP